MPFQTSGTSLTPAQPATAASEHLGRPEHQPHPSAARCRASWAWQRETLLRGEALASGDPSTISLALMLRIALGHHPVNAETPLCAPGPCLAVLAAVQLLYRLPGPEIADAC